MLLPRLKAVLYKYRIFFSVVLLLATLYFVLYSWLALPSLVLSLGWQPDTEFRVLQLVEDVYSQYVQPGDRVLAIDGRSVQRGRLVFIPPVRPAYELTLQRGQEIFTQQIPVAASPLFQMWQVANSTLALAFWLIGFMTVQFARPGQAPAVYVGLSFQLIAAGIVSPGPSQLGAPGAWLVGHVLIFYFPLIMLYLGFVPRYKPLPAPARKLLHGAFYLLTSLAAAAAVEVWFLFPERSFQDVTGINLALILTVLAGISIVATVTLLLVRLLRAPKQSYERQQLAILFAFLALAVTPLFVFVILPVGQVIFVPYPFVYSLFLLAPAGYFFVLHRHGYLALDALFSRLVTVIFLILAIGMTYTTGVYLLEAIFAVDFSGTGQGAFILILFGVAITGQRQVQSGVELLFYGRDRLDPELLEAVRARLAANPEPATVASVLAQVAAHLHVQQTAVLVREGQQYRLLAGDTPLFTIPDTDGYHQVLLRARSPQAMAALPAWVELSIPIQAGGDRLGLLLLSRPLSSYFNARQVETLRDVAGILAFSLLVISLVGAMQALSQQALYEKELQRRQIATEIHNEPLHTLTTLTMQLQARASDEVSQQVVQTIRQVTQKLRRIISGLHPSVLRESVEWIARQVVREFDETHEGISVTLALDICLDKQATQQTKLAFYYILTEALNNVSKHAQATRVDVTCHYKEGILALEVRDNGVGAGVATRPLTELLRGRHLGVADMHRWASIGGGTLEIGSNTPSGTIVKLTLPTPLAAN